MLCHVPTCGEPATWRTTMDGVVLPLCLRHMELAHDMGVTDDQITLMPEKEKAS